MCFSSRGVYMSSAESAQRHLDTLYREHYSWLKGWIRRRLSCDQQASDLAQDTFVRVLGQRRHDTLRQPRAYLSSIARHILVDMFRRRSIEQAYLDTLAHQEEPAHISPEQYHQIVETLLEIDAMLDALGGRTREIFLLAQLDGLTYVAIGRRLGVSTNTVRKHYIRALGHCLMLVED